MCSYKDTHRRTHRNEDITVGTAYEITYTFSGTLRGAKPTARLVRGVVTEINGKDLSVTLDDPRYNPERPRGLKPTYATYVAPAQVKRPWADVEAERAADAAATERRQQEERDRAVAERAEWDATYGETTRLIESAIAPFGGSVVVVEARQVFDLDRRWEEGAHTIPRITVLADTAFAAWVAVNTTDDTLATAITDDTLSSSDSATVLVKAFRTGRFEPTGWTRNVYFKGDAAINEIVRLLSDPEQVAKLDALRTKADAWTNSRWSSGAPPPRPVPRSARSTRTTCGSTGRRAGTASQRSGGSPTNRTGEPREADRTPTSCPHRRRSVTVTGRTATV